MFSFKETLLNVYCYSAERKNVFMILNQTIELKSAARSKNPWKRGLNLMKQHIKPMRKSRGVNQVSKFSLQVYKK